MMRYSEAFKRRMVQKMCGPRAVSAYALARDEGLSQSTLSLWKRQAGTLSGMTTRNKKTEAQENNTRKRPQDWSLEEKLQAVLDASSLSDEELGAYLRSKGLHEGTLNQWRTQVAGALGRPQPKNKKEEGKKKKRTIACKQDLEAAVDNLWTEFFVFSSGNPHALEGLQGGQNRPANPHRIHTFGWCNDLHIDTFWDLFLDFFG